MSDIFLSLFYWDLFSMSAFLFTNSIKEAVTFINGIDVNKFSRLISRIIQKLHLKVNGLAQDCLWQDRKSLERFATVPLSQRECCMLNNI